MLKIMQLYTHTSLSSNLSVWIIPEVPLMPKLLELMLPGSMQQLTGSLSESLADTAPTCEPEEKGKRKKDRRIIKVELNELHSPGGNPSGISNTTRGTVNMGPTFPVVHKLCVCVLEVEERKERIKSPVWMSFSSRHGADCQRVATLTIDRREEQAEQQTLQPRHCSYRCWHCMCVRNSGISSKYKLNSTPVPRSAAASHSHPKVYICIACRRHVYIIESLPTL